MLVGILGHHLSKRPVKTICQNDLSKPVKTTCQNDLSKRSAKTCQNLFTACQGKAKCRIEYRPNGALLYNLLHRCIRRLVGCSRRHERELGDMREVSVRLEPQQMWLG